jgi:hypothetical protein
MKRTQVPLRPVAAVNRLRAGTVPAPVLASGVRGWAALVAGRLDGSDSDWDFLEVEPESFGLWLETE